MLAWLYRAFLPSIWTDDWPEAGLIGSGLLMVGWIVYQTSCTMLLERHDDGLVLRGLVWSRRLRLDDVIAVRVDRPAGGRRQLSLHAADGTRLTFVVDGAAPLAHADGDLAEAVDRELLPQLQTQVADRMHAALCGGTRIAMREPRTTALRTLIHASPPLALVAVFVLMQWVTGSADPRGLIGRIAVGLTCVGYSWSQLSRLRAMWRLGLELDRDGARPAIGGRRRPWSELAPRLQDDEVVLGPELRIDREADNALVLPELVERMQREPDRDG